VIDIIRYPPAIIPPAKPPSPKRPVVIGWVGTPITADYLLGVEQAFRAIAAERAAENCELRTDAQQQTGEVEIAEQLTEQYEELPEPGEERRFLRHQRSHFRQPMRRFVEQRPEKLCGSPP
jgi:hypothetical protein